MRVVDRPFTLGPRQDFDRALTPEGAVFRVQDGRKISETTWGKRHGYASALRTVTGFSAPITGAPQAVGELAGRDVLVADGRAYMRDRRDISLWQESGRASAFKPRKTHWVRYNDTEGSVYQYDIAAAGGLIVVAYTYFDTVLASQLEIQVFDLSGVRVFGRRLADYYGVKLVVIGNDVIMCAIDGTGFSIDAFYWDSGARTLTNPAPVGAVAGSGFGFDVCINPLNELLVVSARTNTTIRLERYTSVGGFSSIANQTVNTGIAAGFLKPTVFANAAAIWVSYRAASTGTAYRFTVTSSVPGVVSGPTSYGADASEAAFCQRDATSVWMMWRSVQAGPPLRYAVYVGACATDGTISGAMNVQHMQLASQPHDGSLEGFRVWMHTDNGKGNADDALNAAWTVQRKYSLETCTVHTDRVVLRPELVPDERSRFDVGGDLLLAGQGPCLPHLARLVVDGKSRYYQASLVPLRGRALDNFSGFGGDSSALVVYEYEKLDYVQLATAGNAGAMLGGHVQELLSSHIEYHPTFNSAGARFGFENGFVRGPAILLVTQSGAGTLPPGLYQACAVYEYIDADGRRHRSAPSNIVSWTVTGAADDGATLTISAFSAFEREVSTTAHQTAVHVYCTGPDGAIFYRVTSNEKAPAAYSIFYNVDFAVLNEPNPAAEILYTVGDVLPNQPAPAHRFGCVAGNRLALGGLFDPRIGEISKFFRPNEPAQFTRAEPFRFVLPEAMTAISYLDGQVVAFSENGIYLVNATSPPNDQGFPALPTPDRLPTDVGALLDTPVIELPAGLVFQSRRGLYLLPRGFGPPKYLSGPMKEDMWGFRVLTYAHVIHEAFPYPVQDADRDFGEHLVYFGVGVSNVEKVLVLDADTLQWVSTDVLHSGSVAHVKAMGTWAGRAVIARETIAANEDLVVEADGYLDTWSTVLNPSPRFRIETGEVRPFGMMGRGAVANARLLVEFREKCSVQMTTIHDGRYSQSYTQPRIEMGTASSPDTKGDRVAIDFKPRAKSSDINSVAYEIEVGLTTAIGGGDELVDSEGVLIHGLGLLVDPVPGMQGLPGNKRA